MEFSSTAAARPPTFTVPPHPKGSPRAEWSAMIQQAEETAPHATFAGAFLPRNVSGAVTLLMARGEMRNFTQMDYVYFDPVTGKQLAYWQRGVLDTWGSRIVFWMSPLHFGSNWGMAVKILWAALGCSLPLLSATGLLMYWNRFLAKRVRAFREKQ